jgi:hypothetical protein
MLVKKNILSIKHVELSRSLIKFDKELSVEGLGLQYLEFRLMFGILKQIQPHPACVPLQMFITSKK